MDGATGRSLTGPTFRKEMSARPRAFRGLLFRVRLYRMPLRRGGRRLIPGARNLVSAAAHDVHSSAVPSTQPPAGARTAATTASGVRLYTPKASKTTPSAAPSSHGRKNTPPLRRLCRSPAALYFQAALPVVGRQQVHREVVHIIDERVPGRRQAAQARVADVQPQAAALRQKRAVVRRPAGGLRPLDLEGDGCQGQVRARQRPWFGRGRRAARGRRPRRPLFGSRGRSRLRGSWLASTLADL